MKKKIVIGLSMLVLVSIGINVMAQIPSTGEPVYYMDYSFRYAEYDTSLPQDGKALIDTIFSLILAKRKDSLSFFDKREIIVNSFMTAKEREKDRLIGMQRCFIILDYVEKKYGVRRSKFLIRDFPPIKNRDSEIQFVFPPARTN